MKKFIEIVVICILGMALFINVFSAIDMPVFGIRIFKIGSGSMEPYLKVNDIIIIKEENNYKIDDVITFKEENHYITHRIVQIDGNTITTKGDNNNTNDASITEDKIIGKLIYKFGILNFLNYLLLKPTSWIVFFILGVLIIIIMPNKKINGRHAKY